MAYDASNPLDLIEVLRDATPAQRHEFSRRAALLGMSGSAVAALLAACGGTSSAPTNTPAGGGAPASGATPVVGVPTVAVNPVNTASAGSAAVPVGTAPAASAATGGSPTTAASSSGKKPKRGGRS